MGNNKFSIFQDAMNTIEALLHGLIVVAIVAGGIALVVWGLFWIL